MQSPDAGSDNNWLKDFIAGAVDDAADAEPMHAATPLPPAWMELIDGPSPGTSIGPYRIDQRIGRGGMGVVFQAFDSTLRRVVAIKFLSPRLAVSPLARTRFTREAQATAAIKNPNIVTIHAIGEYDGLPYLVMEYVAGITLADRLNQEGMLEPKSILRIGIQTARGLAAAHSQGLIHRDVKPANILLESGIDRVKITDFGLAYVMAEPWRLTASGVLLGTPAYMSPEQAAGYALDHRSDLFSLGSVLYHLCTGEPPFPGPTVKTILKQVREGEPRPIRDLNPDIPPALEKHIRRLMAKDPAGRFTSADGLVRTLGDELAEMQGRKCDPSVDDPDYGVQAHELPRGGGQVGTFEIVDSWDDATPSPRTEQAIQAPGVLLAFLCVAASSLALLIAIKVRGVSGQAAAVRGPNLQNAAPAAGPSRAPRVKADPVNNRAIAAGSTSVNTQSPWPNSPIGARGPRGAFGSKTGPGPVDLHLPERPVREFLAALKARDLKRLKEATALCAELNPDPKYRDVFKQILDLTLPDSELDRIAGRLDGYQIAGRALGRSAEVFEDRTVVVIVIRRYADDRSLLSSREVMVAHEIKGWGVMNIGAPQEFDHGGALLMDGSW